MDEKPDEKDGRRIVSLWMEPRLLEAVDTHAKDIERSRSWMICFLLKQALGILPDADKKK